MAMVQAHVSGGAKAAQDVVPLRDVRNLRVNYEGYCTLEYAPAIPFAGQPNVIIRIDVLPGTEFLVKEGILDVKYAEGAAVNTVKMAIADLDESLQRPASWRLARCVDEASKAVTDEHEAADQPLLAAANSTLHSTPPSGTQKKLQVPAGPRQQLLRTLGAIKNHVVDVNFRLFERWMDSMAVKQEFRTEYAKFVPEEEQIDLYSIELAIKSGSVTTEEALFQKLERCGDNAILFWSSAAHAGDPASSDPDDKAAVSYLASGHKTKGAVEFIKAHGLAAFEEQEVTLPRKAKLMAQRALADAVDSEALSSDDTGSAAPGLDALAEASRGFAELDEEDDKDDKDYECSDSDDVDKPAIKRCRMTHEL